jgi:hypothetical protein
MTSIMKVGAGAGTGISIQDLFCHVAKFKKYMKWQEDCVSLAKLDTCAETHQSSQTYSMLQEAAGPLMLVTARESIRHQQRCLRATHLLLRPSTWLTEIFMYPSYPNCI